MLIGNGVPRAETLRHANANFCPHVRSTETRKLRGEDEINAQRHVNEQFAGFDGTPFFCGNSSAASDFFGDHSKRLSPTRIVHKCLCEGAMLFFSPASQNLQKLMLCSLGGIEFL